MSKDFQARAVQYVREDEEKERQVAIARRARDLEAVERDKAHRARLAERRQHEDEEELERCRGEWKSHYGADVADRLEVWRSYFVFPVEARPEPGMPAKAGTFLYTDFERVKRVMSDEFGVAGLLRPEWGEIARVQGRVLVERGVRGVQGVDPDRADLVAFLSKPHPLVERWKRRARLPFRKPEPEIPDTEPVTEDR